MNTGIWVLAVVLLIVSELRWLRVAQREHYAPGRTSDIVGIWCRAIPLNAAILVVTLVAAIVSFWWDWAALIDLLLLVWPLRMSIRPRSSPVRYTPRMRRVVAAVVVVDLAVPLGARSAAAVVVAAVLSFVLVDLVLLVLQPLEKRLSMRFVRSAQRKLEQVHPHVIAITGSYGKTSTKAYAAHIIGRFRSTLPSPASFNNLMGLSMTVNKRLVPGTEVLIAEMGTYGPGEIRRLCAVFHPQVSAITTIGEAHLERMKTRATIVAAKSEITELAQTVVLNVDVPELAELADALTASKRVINCSAGGAHQADAVVSAEGEVWSVSVGQRHIADVDAPATGHPINLAIAVGLALAEGIQADQIATTLKDLPTAPHRAEVQRMPDGPLVIDDTYNANPDGARKVLQAASAAVGGTGVVWTVTPGMIELGSEQDVRNRELAREATLSDQMNLVVTGYTNRRALIGGARAGGQVRTYNDRASASRAVLTEARAGDVIVFLNDLPDHYP